MGKEEKVHIFQEARMWEMMVVVQLGAGGQVGKEDREEKGGQE